MKPGLYVLHVEKSMTYEKYIPVLLNLPHLGSEQKDCYQINSKRQVRQPSAFITANSTR